MKNLYSSIERFFFAPRSATSFGLLRICWAATMIVRMLVQSPDILRYYSNGGVLPVFLNPLFVRPDWRFSLLDIIATPTGVLCVYLGLLVFLVLMLIGKYPRLSTIVSVLLVFSFHERNPYPLSGGDTVLRLMGFVLIVSPGIEALSVQRLRLQWAHWKEHKRLLPPVQMPVWPWRLLLWQLIVIYVMSVWSKLIGDMWRWGTVSDLVLHHPHFSRIGGKTADALSAFTIPLTYTTLLYEAAWILMLLPRRFFARIPVFRRGGLRRLLIASGLVFHWSIDRLMAVGYFFPSMGAGFLGLLEKEDFEVLRKFCNRRHTGEISVLYDSHCGFCTRSVFSLMMMDNLHRIQAVDYHDAKARAAVAPDLKFKDLDKAMHIRFADGRTEKAFFAFRALTWQLPVLWPLAPFLYVPGIAWIGEKVYTRVSRKRVRCSHGECKT